MFTCSVSLDVSPRTPLTYSLPQNPTYAHLSSYWPFGSFIPITATDLYTVYKYLTTIQGLQSSFSLKMESEAVLKMGIPRVMHSLENQFLK